MAKVIYRVQAPDGSQLSQVVGDDPPRTLAVLGLMRLRKPLPKINPDDASEVIRYDRRKAWVLIGTVTDERGAQTLIKCQGYRGITEETRVVPVVAEPYESTRPAPTWLHPTRSHTEVRL